MKKLLLADDSPTIERMIRLNFEGDKIEILCAQDGQSAIDLFETERPDIVLADVYMPQKNGFQVCRHIKNHSRCPRIPVLLLIGSFEPFNEEEAEQVHADGVLVKPLDSQQLLQTVHRLLEQNDRKTGTEAPMAENPNDDFLELLDLEEWNDTEPSKPPAPIPPPTAELAVKAKEAAPPSREEETSPLPAIYVESADFLEIGPMEAFLSGRETVEPEELLLELPSLDLEIEGRVFMETESFDLRPLAISTPHASAVSAADQEQEAATVAAPSSDWPAVFGDRLGPTPPITLSEEDIDRIARRVVTHLSVSVLKEIAWEVVPDLAAAIVRQEAYRQTDPLP